MIQWLIGLVTLTEDLNLVLSNHMLVHSHLDLQFYGIKCFLLTSMGTRHGIHTCIQAKYVYT